MRPRAIGYCRGAGRSEMETGEIERKASVRGWPRATVMIRARLRDGREIIGEFEGRTGHGIAATVAIGGMAYRSRDIAEIALQGAPGRKRRLRQPVSNPSGRSGLGDPSET
jgi:hypothetical protein